jgi:hypothetical protein
MLANVLMNIKHQCSDFKIRNDEVDCFNKETGNSPLRDAAKIELNIQRSYFHSISTHLVRNHLLVVKSGSRGSAFRMKSGAPAVCPGL